MLKKALMLFALMLPGLWFGSSFSQVPDTASPRSAKAVLRSVTADEALSYFRRQDWPHAVEAYGRLISENPYDGQYWYNYGLALHSLKRYQEAIKAAEKAAELGYQRNAALYNIACARALLGQKDEALSGLQTALESGFSQDELLRTDSDLDSLRGDPRFEKLLGVAPHGLSRAERWAFDLDYLVRRMEKVHYNLYAKVSRHGLQSAVNDLKARVTALKDEEMAVGVQRILALVGDGHTTLMREGPGRPVPPRYPLVLYLFKEGLYVRSAAPEFAEIVGGEVLRIGNASAEEALHAVAPLCSHDNAMGIKLLGPQYLADPAVLSYLKLAEDITRVRLVVKKPGGEQVQVELRPSKFAESQIMKFVRANARAKSPEPLSFQKDHERFWFEYLPEKKLVYFQYNQVGNKAEETLEKFCGRLFAFINDKTVEYLVIDMRNNGGGNNFLNRPIVHGLIRSDKINRSGHLFVLVGRRTFSAAMNGTVDIERNTQAIFVGEPTGSSPNFVGETNVLVLPCSGLRVSCSSLYWQSSTAMDHRSWIAPSLLAEPSLIAFAQNRDPGLEAIFAYIEARVGGQTQALGHQTPAGAPKQ
jgi:hypothetical protein